MIGISQPSLSIFAMLVLPADAHCFVKLSGPLFVTVPNSPLEVMSVVPVKEVPFTVPWNVISIEPPNGNWL